MASLFRILNKDAILIKARSNQLIANNYHWHTTQHSWWLFRLVSD